jgi:glycolate oxidase
MSLSKPILDQLCAIVGKTALLTSDADLRVYAYDGTSNWQSMPDAVVFPTTEQQISEIMMLANQHDLPVTVRGAGTNLSGGSIPVKGGIVLCTARMNAILQIDENNFTATVEVGVVLNDLNKKLAEKELFFPPDPQSFLAATIGGCVSENSGGPYALKYGIFKHYLLGMRVVLPTGEILNLGGKTVKNVTGYDLPLLLCGSEGTLAVITRVTLRVISLPEARQTILAVFDEMVDAGKAVAFVLSHGLLPAKIELMDNWIIQRIEENTPLGLPVEAQAILLFETDGIAETVEKETERIIDLCRQAGAVKVKPAADDAEAANFWTARRAGFSAVFGNAPTVLAEDVTVPIDQLPALIQRVKDIGNTYDITIPMIGHAGDGNLHPCILTDRNDPEHYAKARQAASDIFDAALSLGGVISGEHGIGLEKKEFLSRAMDPGAIALLRKIKAVFDPKGILNPGKIWENP